MMSRRPHLRWWRPSEKECGLSSVNGTAFDFPTTPNSTRVFLIRHGATAANERRPFVLQGCEIDGPLTANGVRQTASLTRFLAGVSLTAIYSSPMQRALQTVAEIAGTRSLPITTVEALRECHVGQWAGLSWDEIRQRDADHSARFLADPANEPHPGGESYLDLQTRVLPAFNDIVARHPGDNVLILAHNMVNRVLLASLLGLELRYARKIKQMNSCINILQHTAAGTEIVTMNSVWHLKEVDRVG